MVYEKSNKDTAPLSGAQVLWTEILQIGHSVRLPSVQWTVAAGEIRSLSQDMTMSEAAHQNPAWCENRSWCGALGRPAFPVSLEPENQKSN